MKKLLMLSLLVFLFVAPASAEESRQTSETISIQDVLPGTWDYLSSSPTKDGVFQSIEPTKIYWTLNPDGSGVYYRKINQFNAASIHDELRWSVQDSTLTMDGDLHYTIIDWSQSQMTWLNPSKSTYFRVERRE